MGVTMAHTARLPRAILGLALAVGSALALVIVQSPAAHAGENETIYSLVNDARWSQGSAGLVRNPALDAVAADWADALAAAGTLSHNPEYSNQIPSGWSSAGENVAQGHSGGAAMHEGWMNSDGHRANILGNFTDIGIAYLEAGGTTWGVEVFANYPGSVGPSASAGAVAPAAPEESAPVAEAPTVEPPVTVPAPASAPVPTDPPSSPSSRSYDASEFRQRDTATAGVLEGRALLSSRGSEDVDPQSSSALWALVLGSALVIGVAARRALLLVRSRRQA